MSAATVAAFDAVSLLESLRGRGAQVSIKGTGAGAWLHVAPRAVLSDGERADFRRHKRELLAAFDAPNELAPVHRWQSATDDAATGTAQPDVAASATTGSAAAIALGDGAPDLAALSRAVAGAQRGAFISPTPELMARWKALDQYIGVKLTSRHIGAAARLVAQHPQLDNNELLELFAAGVQPDEGAGKPVWIEPEQLADETHAATKARAKTGDEVTA